MTMWAFLLNRFLRKFREFFLIPWVGWVGVLFLRCWSSSAMWVGGGGGAKHSKIYHILSCLLYSTYSSGWIYFLHKWSLAWEGVSHVMTFQRSRPHGSFKCLRSGGGIQVDHWSTISSLIWVSACWAHFMCHRELSPVPSLFSVILALLEENKIKAKRTTIPIFGLVLQNVAFPCRFPYIFCYPYYFSVLYFDWVVITVCGSNSIQGISYELD